MKLITAPEVKFAPLMDNVNAALPARALVGEIVLRTGGGDVTVKVSELVEFWRDGSATET